ncbi:MAG: tetratricopeptide repeat protein [Burkholderiales bacterium]|nr:MAG: tetratricopeptide repeat protein [Burkholderiales bacterium]
MTVARSVRRPIGSIAPLAAICIGVGLGIATAWLPSAQAQLFADDEARRAIIEVRGRVNAQQEEIRALLRQGQDTVDRLDRVTVQMERLEQIGRGQLELANQIESLRSELAQLRGQLEVQAAQLANTQKKQNELLAVVDERLKRFEPVQVTIDQQTVMVDPSEKARYDAALGLFREGDFAGALSSLERLRQDFPETPYLSNVLFWSGSAQYALREFKASLATQQEYLKRFPDGMRAAEALLMVGNAQLETGDARAARRTYDSVIARYAGTPAANAAADKLNSIKSR